MRCREPFGVANEEVDAVEHIGFAGVVVEVDEEDREAGHDLFEALLDALGDDLVGDAAKGLEAQNILHAMATELQDLAGDEPALTIAIDEFEDIASEFRELARGGKEGGEGEGFEDLVDFFEETGDAGFEDVAHHPGEVGGTQAVVAVVLGVGDLLDEEGGQLRDDDFDPLLGQPIDHVVIGVVAVFDIDFADDADAGDDAVVVRDRREALDGLGDEGEGFFGAVFGELDPALDVLIDQRLGLSWFFFSDGQGAAHHGEGVADDDGVEGQRDDLDAVEGEARLRMEAGTGELEGDHRDVGVAGANQALLRRLR